MKKAKTGDLLFNEHHKNPRRISSKSFAQLRETLEEFGDISGIVHNIGTTPDELISGNQRSKVIDIKRCKIVLNEEFKQPDEQGTIARGYVIWKGSRYSYRRVNWSAEKADRANIIANKAGGEFDMEILLNDWDRGVLLETGFEPADFDFSSNSFAEDEETETEGTTEGTEIIAHQKLSERFIVPPFSVLDTRQGYWMERKRYWKDLINDNGESREGVLAKGEKNIMAKTNNGVSILDPVLAEIANFWFSPAKPAKTFDPFAGDTVFGYVSSYLGHNFTGIELRAEQAAHNNKRCEGLNARYICDDGRNIAQHIKKDSQDLLFSCPPYFDLEVYSDLPDDASNQKEYADFIAILETAFAGAVQCLKTNRFAFIVVGDMRDKNGAYRGFPDDIKRIFKQQGLLLYNELVLVEPLGTLPQRVGRYMKNRKVGKCHQNILVFYKGDTSKIKSEFEEITIELEKEELPF